MAAPKGNQFWKIRAKHGRDAIFTEAEVLRKEVDSYFEWCQKNPFKEQVIQKIKVDRYREEIKKVDVNKPRPFTLIGLCLYLGVNTRYFEEFRKLVYGKTRGKYKDFPAVLTYIEETIRDQKYTGAASGFFNASIVARDLGLADKTDSKQEHSGEIKITRKVVK